VIAGPRRNGDHLQAVPLDLLAGKGFGAITQREHADERCRPHDDTERRQRRPDRIGSQGLQAGLY
jgi:hypothetical protein